MTCEGKSSEGGSETCELTDVGDAKEGCHDARGDEEDRR